MFKKIISALIAAFFALSLVPAASSSSFPDVDDGVWYADYVEAVMAAGVMEGRGGGVFDPDGEITRAEFATALFRLSGDEAPATAPSFCDVAPEAWDRPYVAWAESRVIVMGYPGGAFAPDAPVLRSESAAMIVRFLKAFGFVLDEAEDAAEPFSDVDPDAWYSGGVELLRAAGLARGDGSGCFSPSATTTRAEAAAFFIRLSDATAEADPFADQISTVRIDTETGRDVESKEVYIGTAFSLTAPDGRDISYDNAQIRGRGQASWGLEKKPYKLKFPEKVCLMDSSGSGTKAKDWTLIPGHSDRSLIRNWLAFKLASKLDGIEWTPYGELVRLRAAVRPRVRLPQRRIQRRVYALRTRRGREGKSRYQGRQQGQHRLPHRVRFVGDRRVQQRYVLRRGHQVFRAERL